MAKRPIAVAALKHDAATRRNIPTAEFESVMREQDKAPVRLAYERRNRDLDPQLVWRGKDSQDWSDLVVHAPPLFIQEKVHPKVLIDDLKRETKARVSEAEAAPDLFADFNGLSGSDKATEFYQHDQHWSNRMIAGDSLSVMASLAEREGLRGKVQCIYLDPPYGIKFNSNFQWSTTSRDVKDGAKDHITREPEQVRAFRDTWRDGIHSYLTYLRDRLTVARDLLHESGSIFVQIGDENVHRVRAVMDEVFGDENFVVLITVQKTGAQPSERLAGVADYILWYARETNKLKARLLYRPKEQGIGHGSGGRYTSRDQEGRWYRQTILTSSRPPGSFPVEFEGRTYTPRGRYWTTGEIGLAKLKIADRIESSGKTINYKRYLEDFPAYPLTSIWTEVAGSPDKLYVVQTSPAVIQRCILMTTDPGDLVLDPTCGSGTTATVSEQWGRRWITIDTSRVAIALARSRLMGARYPYYLLADSPEGQRKEADVTRSTPKSAPTRGDIRHGFVYERVPHITLKSIANNAEIDVIWERWQEQLEPLRAKLNEALGRSLLPRAGEEPAPGLIRGGSRSETDEGQRNSPHPGPLPQAGEGARAWEEWQIPREAETKWPAAAKDAHAKWWQARIARQTEIDASIAAKAEHEFLYDKPYADNSRIRVAGPFTVESVSPHRTLAVDWNDELVGMSGASGSCKETGPGYRYDGPEPKRDFAQMILDNLRAAGVQQAAKADRIAFTSLTGWPGRYVCAEGVFSGEWLVDSEKRKLATNHSPQTTMRAGIFVGPEFGTVSRPDLVAAAREAGDAGFDVLISCAFNYDAHSSEFERLGRVPVLKARMNPDLHMGGELKATASGNLFVVFGEPDMEVVSGQWLVASGGRLVANYERVAQLPGFGSLEEINRLGRSNLQRYKELASGREVRSHQPDTAGGGLGSVQHRRGSGASGVSGIPAVPEHCDGIAGGSRDTANPGGEVRLSAWIAAAAIAGDNGRDRPHALRPDEIAALEDLNVADFPLTLTTNHYTQVTVRGVDVFKPQSGEVVSEGTDGIALWMLDTDYNEESFFVRHAYFLGANDPYKALKTTLKAEIDEDAWASLHSDVSRPFPKPASRRIAVKVINHLGDEVMKVFAV